MGNVSINEELIMPDIARFSNFYKLIRTTAFVSKMLKLLCAKKSEKPKLPSVPGNKMSKRLSKLLDIGAKEIQEAKYMWYKHVQNEAFRQEYADLQQMGLVKKSSRLYKYSPFICDGVIRMKGRIHDNSKPFDVNNPVILPNRHPFTTLLIQTFHDANLHFGTNTVINNLNTHFRILKCNSEVKKVKYNCTRCKELKAQPQVP